MEHTSAGETLSRIHQALNAAVSAISSFIPGAVMAEHKAAGHGPVTEATESPTACSASIFSAREKAGFRRKRSMIYRGWKKSACGWLIPWTGPSSLWRASPNGACPWRW